MANGLVMQVVLAIIIKEAWTSLLSAGDCIKIELHTGDDAPFIG